MAIRKILIANRGEIACRIAAAARTMGLETLGVYARSDFEAVHVAAVDCAIALDADSAADTYLDGVRLIEIAQAHGADAIHPGYGFLSEDASFAEAVAAAGLSFVGPPAAVLRKVGDKAQAKALMKAHGVPTIAGEPLDETAHASSLGESIGYPLLVKASQGGGGMGMRRVDGAEDLPEAITQATHEAKAAFGDGSLILEKYLGNAKHIEVQVFGNRDGAVFIQGVRDCSLQRRRQKVVEESSSHLSPALRTRVGELARQAAQAVGYQCAGTVEFLLSDEKFYFLEINARIQVEHRVTELSSDIDLVRKQLEFAAGSLQLTEDSEERGHSIECRLYAEDPENEYRASTGTVRAWRPPPRSLCDIVDSGVAVGTRVSHHFDPLLAKFVVWGPDRDTAVGRMRLALEQAVCLGIRTNHAQLLAAVKSEPFAAGLANTQTLESMPLPPVNMERIICAWAALDSIASQQPFVPGLAHGWRNNETRGQHRSIVINESPVDFTYRSGNEQLLRVRYDEREFTVRFVASDASIQLEVDSVTATLAYARDRDKDVTWIHDPAYGPVRVSVRPPDYGDDIAAAAGGHVAPMPGRIVRVVAEIGQSVAAGEAVVVLSSMKTETAIVSDHAGVVASLRVEEGEDVAAGDVLFTLEES